MSATLLETPNQIPKRPKGSLRPFKSVDALIEYFQKIDPSIERIPNSSETYKGLYDWHLRQVAEDINDTSWFGDPAPGTVEAGVSRSRYQNMQEFNRIYNEKIKPRLQDILRYSQADLEMPKFKYNDLGLGIFDFNKASSGLVPIYKFYSFQKKELVDGSEVENYTKNGRVMYRLKSDDSAVVVVPQLRGEPDPKVVQKAFREVYDGANVFEVLKKYDLKIGGAEAFTSSIKKSYMQREKVVKPKNAVRIFVKVGENSNIRWGQYQWNGYTAIGIAELLEYMGYSVSIIGVCGIATNGDHLLNDNGKLVEGTRFFGITLKSFDENLDAASLLYVTSDPSFFRIKFFECMIKQAQLYKDKMGHSLGRSASMDVLEDMIFNEYGVRDKMFYDNGKANENAPFLYYTIGDIYSEQGIDTAVLEIALNVVNKNREARAKLMGTEAERKITMDELKKKLKEKK